MFPAADPDAALQPDRKKPSKWVSCPVRLRAAQVSAVHHEVRNLVRLERLTGVYQGTCHKYDSTGRPIWTR
jgi:hypothetical protein